MVVPDTAADTEAFMLTERRRPVKLDIVQMLGDQSRQARAGRRLMALGSRRRASAARPSTSCARCCCGTPMRSCSPRSQRTSDAVAELPPVAGRRRDWSASAAGGAGPTARGFTTLRGDVRSATSARGLYLTFYGEGDKRERGTALLRLKRLYRAAGLPLAGTELPDYLPVMLEFAAAAPSGYGEIVLREHRAALELVRLSLRERETPVRASP